MTTNAQRTGLPILLLLLAGHAGAGEPPARNLARAPGPGDAPLVVQDESNRIVVSDGAGKTDIAAPKNARVHAVERVGDGWVVAGTAPHGNGREIWLRRGARGAAVAVSPPPGRRGALRHGAVALSNATDLVGLAWLEGDERQSYEVRFASWNGDAFAMPSVVAPAGRGSQLALRGARLADGRLLLVWAGYDGQDDEIWASLGDGSRWSAPVRVGENNGVPDIKPDVAAVGNGALIAWSRFDGSEYQVVVTRFDGSRFLAARPVAAPGSLYATFEGDGAQRGLLFLDARRGGWALLELDDAGTPGRLGRLDRRSAGERPLVRLSARGVDWRLSDSHGATAWE